MYIKYLQLLNFRNYDLLNLELSPNINVFIGDNAQGKTNILESIYFCSIGKSHRTNRDKEVIKWNEKEAYIKIYVKKQRLDKKIEVKVLKDGKKAININSIKMNKLNELIGTINVIMFSPEDLRLVKESPSVRRKFLDIELSKLNHKYYFNLVQYNKVLEQRNYLLKKSKVIEDDMLDVYDFQLTKYGSEIIKERYKYINNLNLKGDVIHRNITSGLESINIVYETCIKDYSNCESELLKVLRKNRNGDKEKRTTSVGPHRDDFNIFINNMDAKSFGSQGQQRTAVLTMKFASLDIIKDEIHENPILLLDDVLSELDGKRQKYILNSIKDIQTIITTTGINNLNDYVGKNTKVYSIKNGQLV